MKKVLKFPPGFYWGAATASHQIEGGQKNDWSEWEKKNAERLARESEKSFWWNPHWQKFRAEATDPQNYISGIACDSWNRYEEDFNIVQFLGLNAYRFSIEWSRIEPEEGKFNQEAILRYKKMIKSLRARDIEPFVTLWHWTVPIWLSDRGGTRAKDFPQKFKIYTQKIVSALGDDVKFWITLNEPDLKTAHSYLKGVWTAQKKNPFLYFRALSNLIKAHKLAYVVIKNRSKNNQIGIAQNIISYEMYRSTILNKVLKWLADHFRNDYFLSKISKHQDFIGLNHYNRNVINNGYNKNPNVEQTDFGWEFYPESIYQTLIELKKYQKPIYITENGIADATDRLREKFIVRSLASVHRAIEEGVKVRGYFYWSLLDNFEWDKGYWLRFGLVNVDRKTQERTIRDSAYVYKTISDDNRLEVEI